MQHVVLGRIELLEVIGQIALGDQPREIQMRDIPLVRLAHIDHDQVFAVILQTSAQVLHRDLDACIGFHTQTLVKLGATKAEVEEALGMAVYMGGGPSLIYAANAIGAWNEYAAAAPAG